MPDEAYIITEGRSQDEVSGSRDDKSGMRDQEAGMRDEEAGMREVRNLVFYAQSTSAVTSG